MKIILLWNDIIGWVSGKGIVTWGFVCTMFIGGALGRDSSGKKREEAGVAEWRSPWQIWGHHGSSATLRVCQSCLPLPCGMWAAWEKTWPGIRQVCNWGRPDRAAAWSWQHSGSRWLGDSKSFFGGGSWCCVIITITNIDIYNMPEIIFFHNCLYLWWKISGVNFKKQGGYTICKNNFREMWVQPSGDHGSRSLLTLVIVGNLCVEHFVNTDIFGMLKVC